ncbi:hypothetical protein [Nonomuraea sp. NPDC050310]|uniref:hypothetical protein n=1 Tax=Nonomuraea sp. NPDC050310 TaxID=3154935 RepID=UPI0033E1BC25
MQDISSTTPTATRPVAAGLVYTLRVLILVHAVSLIVAAAMAGSSFAYQGEALTFDNTATEPHVMVGMVSHLLSLLQLIAAILYWRPGRGAGWPALVSLLLLVMSIGQHFLLAIGINAHLPNGVLLFGLSLWLTVWSWSQRATVRHG